MSRTARWRGEDRWLMEGGSRHEPQKDERSGNILQPWGFSKKCKCFNIKVWQLLAASSHSSFICCTSFVLLKYILGPDIKPFHTNHPFSPAKGMLKICLKNPKRNSAKSCQQKHTHLRQRNRHAGVGFREALTFLSYLLKNNKIQK